MKLFKSPLTLALFALALGGGAAAYASIADRTATPNDAAEGSAQDGKGTDGATQEKDQARDAETKEDKVLHESMETLGRNMKAMRKLMSKPEKKADALKACAQMEEAILTGLGHVPKPAEKLEGTKLLEFEVGFKKRMAATYITVLELELALEAGDTEEAKTLYRSLGGHKKESHEVYLPEDH